MKLPEPGGLIRRASVARLLDESVSTVRRRERDDATFPRPVRVSVTARSVAYRTDDVLKWIAQRPTAGANPAITAAATAALAAKRRAEQRGMSSGGRESE